MSLKSASTPLTPGAVSINEYRLLNAGSTSFGRPTSLGCSTLSDLSSRAHSAFDAPTATSNACHMYMISADCCARLQPSTGRSAPIGAPNRPPTGVRGESKDLTNVARRERIHAAWVTYLPPIEPSMSIRSCHGLSGYDHNASVTSCARVSR